MSSTALYKAFIEAGAPDEAATTAADDVIRFHSFPNLLPRLILPTWRPGC